MSAIEAVAAAGSLTRSPDLTIGSSAAAVPAGAAAPADFGSLIANGIDALDSKIARADELVAQFAIDDSIPVHQVTIALEEARLSLEFAMQVRARLVEGYQQLMNMQL